MNKKIGWIIAGTSIIVTSTIIISLIANHNKTKVHTIDQQTDTK